MTRFTAVNSEGFPAPIGLAADPVILTVTDGRLAVLLAQRTEEPKLGCWALPGGFVGETESPEETVLRKLDEKTGVAPVHLEQVRLYAEPNRDSRGWLPSVSYLALAPQSDLPDGRGAAWHFVDDLPADLAFDHATMIADALQRLQDRIDDKRWFLQLARGYLPDTFTLRAVQELWQTLAGRTADTANFRRDVTGPGSLLEPTGEKVSGGRPGPPAAVYRFA